MAGCLSDTPSTESTARDGNGTAQSPATTTTSDDSSLAGETSIASLSVRDYVMYPLSGTHPHVHRRAETQYVLVRLQTTTDERTLRSQLSLSLDAESIPLAERQPVSWENETVDVAFAVSKSETYAGGSVLVDDTELRSLSPTTLDRLNNPPAFEVSDVTVSPAEIRADETTDATVQFDVANTGDGAGEFAASLSGNYVSGYNTVTETVDAGDHRELSARTTVVGNGDAARVGLDWGTDRWTGSILVVSEETTDA